MTTHELARKLLVFYLPKCWPLERLKCVADFPLGLFLVVPPSSTKRAQDTTAPQLVNGYQLGGRQGANLMVPAGPTVDAVPRPGRSGRPGR